jgi:hypothetical protein
MVRPEEVRLKQHNSVTRFIAVIVFILVTTKAPTKHEPKTYIKQQIGAQALNTLIWVSCNDLDRLQILAVMKYSLILIINSPLTSRPLCSTPLIVSF